MTDEHIPTHPCRHDLRDRRHPLCQRRAASRLRLRAGRRRRLRPVRRAAGDDVRFLGGTDDYSLKNVLAAEAAGVRRASTSPLTLFVSPRSAAPLAIAFDDFVRTSSDPRHVPAVQRLWRRCAAAGDLYRRSYEGDYCVGCERFYAAGEPVDGHCPEHLTAVERVAEENWFFRLSRYQRRHRASSSRRGSWRSTRGSSATRCSPFVRRGLDDISVSRVDRARPGWGVAVPGDDTQIVYVWFDALTNYLTSLDFGDPASEHYRQLVGAVRPPRPRDRQGHPALPRRVLAGVPRLGRAAGTDAHRGPPVPHRRRREDLQVGGARVRPAAARAYRARRALRHRCGAMVVRP